MTPFLRETAAALARRRPRAVIEAGTYRTVAGELLHVRLDAQGHARCELEALDGSLRDGCEIRDADVLLSDDPEWPCRDPRVLPTLAIID